MAKKKPPADLRYDWDEALLWELQEALNEFKQFPLLGQIGALKVLAHYL
jgi:hypothetical protein